jgi:hypothetical protein
MNKKNAGLTLAAFGLCVAAFQWAQIAYRLKLFLFDYSRQKYVSHIGDGDFMLAYFVDGLMIVVGLGSLLFLRGQSLRLRASAWCPLILNVLGAMTLFVMHKAGVLVEYSEFIGHMKGTC